MHPTAVETEDNVAAAYLEREMNTGAPTQMLLQPTAAQETLPAAGTMGADESVVVDTQVITQTPLNHFHVFLVLGWGRYSTQVVNAGVHAGARYSMQAANELERSLVVSLTSDGPIFEGAVEYVLRQFPPLPVAEGPETIPKNSAGMGPAPRAVMFPPTHPPHFN